MPIVSRPKHAASGLLRFLSAILFVGSAGCGAAEGESEPDELLERARGSFDVLEPVPEEALDAPDIVLGQHLFWDERISSDGTTSCASCHTVESWGADRRRLSVDARGELTARHSQTVFNSMEQPSIRWLGDRTDGAHQAERSITGSMGLDGEEALTPLLLEHGYEELFWRAFPDDPDPVSATNYGQAIQAYQSTLVTPAPFDDFLGGDTEALTSDQRAGLELFIQNGCVACHSGALLGGGSMQRFGIAEDYWIHTGSEEIDEGLYAVTQEESDRYLFRTPMLRNVAKTGPYFHDGSVDTLEDAVRIMSRVQFGRELSDEDVVRITSFLESLTGEIPPNYGPPESPE